jgi:hypothetical protein
MEKLREKRREEKRRKKKHVTSVPFVPGERQQQQQASERASERSSDGDGDGDGDGVRCSLTDRSVLLPRSLRSRKMVAMESAAGGSFR